MAEKFPTPQERAMAWLLEAPEISGMSRPETALYAYQHGWMAAADAKTLKSMTRAQAHLMFAECDLLDALEANEKKEKNNEQ